MLREVPVQKMKEALKRTFIFLIWGLFCTVTENVYL